MTESIQIRNRNERYIETDKWAQWCGPIYEVRRQNGGIRYVRDWAEYDIIGNEYFREWTALENYSAQYNLSIDKAE